MARKERFSLDNLKLLDYGKIHAAFEMELAHVMADLKDRPSDEKARTLNLKFELKPVLSDPSRNGGVLELEKVDLKAVVTSSVPKRQTSVYTMNVNAQGDIFFHPENPGDPNDDRLFDNHAEKADHES